MAELDDPAQTDPVLALLVCRVRLYCDAIVGLLETQGGIVLVGVADPGQDLIPHLDTKTPNVVLFDAGTSHALATAARVIRERPDTRILGFGVHDVPEEVVACAEAGLAGYVPSTASIRDLVTAAQRVAKGDTVCSVTMAAGLFRHLRGHAQGTLPSALETILTQRQQEIVRLIGGGLSNKQIALRLSLGTSTVKNHVHDILDRLQVTSRSEAAARLHRSPRLS
jgi:two-component system nitrate/nitrite response regulator NarL